MSNRKDYSREFKLQACRTVLEKGYSYAEVARKLGTSSQSLREWVKKFRAEGVLPPPGQVIPDAEELARLRSAYKQLQEENEILKKAAAYFAKASL